MTFLDKLEATQQDNQSLLCVGLDPVLDKMPPGFQAQDHPLLTFNKWIVDQTKDYVCAFKPNSAFYEAHGADGVYQLQKTCEYIHEQTDIPVIIDAKRGDIGSTSEAYAKYIFEYLQADAVTVNPYLGQTSLEPFLQREDKGIIVLCRTSNQGSDEFQDLSVGMYTPLWEEVAQKVRDKWNTKGNCFLVMGATNPEEIKELRTLVPDLTLLVPGVGAQGGDLEKTLEYGLNSQGRGLIITSSRSIIYDDNPGVAAKALRDQINASRDKAEDLVS